MLGKSRTDKPALKLEGLESREVPTIFANADQYSAVAGQVLTVAVGQGVLANDFSDRVGSDGLQPRLTASLTGPVRYVAPDGTTAGLPPLPIYNGIQSVVLNQDGSFRFIAPSADQIPAGVQQVQFQYTVTSGLPLDLPQIGTVTIDLALRQNRLIAAAPEAGSEPIVRAYDATNGSIINYLQNLQPYESGFTGGVRVAVGDINFDGWDDVATVPASGGSARLVVFSGKTGERLLDQIVFDPTFRGGAYLAIGDVNGDTRQDLIVGSGEGGGPRVQVLSFTRPSPIPGTGALGTVSVLGDFFVYEATARTGVRVAAGDLRGEGRDLLVVTPGVGGGPRVRVIDPQATGVQVANPAAFGRPVPSGQVAVSVNEFFAADSTNRDGVFVSTGNLRGDGKFDIITGSGAGSALVQVFDGRTGGLVRQFAPPVADLPTGFGVSGVSVVNGQQVTGNGTLLNTSQNPGSLIPAGIAGPAGTNPFFRNTGGGARVAATDFNGDGLDDFVVGTGPGNQPRVRVYDGRNQSLLASIQPFESTFLGGVNVGAN